MYREKQLISQFINIQHPDTHIPCTDQNQVKRSFRCMGRPRIYAQLNLNFKIIIQIYTKQNTHL